MSFNVKRVTFHVTREARTGTEVNNAPGGHMRMRRSTFTKLHEVISEIVETNSRTIVPTTNHSAQGIGDIVQANHRQSNIVQGASSSTGNQATPNDWMWNMDGETAERFFQSRHAAGSESHPEPPPPSNPTGGEQSTQLRRKTKLKWSSPFSTEWGYYPSEPYYSFDSSESLPREYPRDAGDRT